ncbi:MAG TPA: class I SAM-dependent methyltransferase [Streptosporangiaceae bacterium]
MTAEPRDIVAAGYDRIAARHLAWINEIHGDPRLRFLADLMAWLPAHPAVLDLGCGAGVPCTALLAERVAECGERGERGGCGSCGGGGEVIGVDLSARQLELARRKVPGARFIHADMTTLDLPPASLDAVTAFYSIVHVPRGQHRSLFRRIATWLRPGGLFLAALGCGGDEGTTEQWLGEPMFFSSHGAPTNRRLLTDAGLTLLADEIVTMQEPEGPATFHWLITQRAPHPPT